MSVRTAQVDLVCSATTAGLMAPATIRILGSIPSPEEEGAHDRRYVAGATPHTAVGSLSGEDGLREVDEVLDEAEVVTSPYGRGLRLVGVYIYIFTDKCGGFRGRGLVGHAFSWRF